jgi:hypothetical protein
MRNIKAIAAAGLVLASFAAGPAHAHGVRFGIGIGFPIYPAPYYYPPPAYYYPPPVYVQPAPVYVEPPQAIAPLTSGAGRAAGRAVLVLLRRFEDLLSLREELRQPVAAGETAAAELSGRRLTSRVRARR